MQHTRFTTIHTIDVLFDFVYTRLILSPANQLITWLNSLQTGYGFEIQL